AVLDIVEIDPEVLRLCKKYFFFQESDRCRVHEGDGRLFVQNRRGREAYDLVYLDAFKSGSIPYHLKTRAFYEEIRSILRPSGVVASNLYGKSNRLKPQDRATFVSVFPQVECFEDPDQRATVLIATREAQSWTVEELLDRAERLADSPGFSWPQVARMFRPGRFAEGAAEPFEDDFGPGEFLETVRRNNTDQKG
ncbi:MAG: hypothetical protein GWM98_10005, partial [Nitrospinaceae bacterium]|nr:hypothetical protein [Nitrospinaceae bacterium]NIR54762.1 hypothetical protein [Nitrospinaceae bacterium]NIS85187.1 hypothetical protein [Nitrospinaceae bacterium]NIT81998.1 hypothetical protein [Nitrospinaceae bacterium]NIU44261.1 hypothetical protein [Nitrospinaceae bacterium]